MAKTKNITYASPEGSYWLAESRDFDAVMTDAGASNLSCSRLTMKFTRTVPATLTEDRAMTHFWFAKSAGGGLFSYVPTSELDDVEVFVDAFFTTIKTRIADDFVLAEYAWHTYEWDTPRTDDGKGQKPGPAVRVVTKSVAGTDASSTLPHQVAMNVTLRTASRRHWGRSAFPGLTNGSLQGNYGRWSSGVVDEWANAVNTLHDNAQAASYQLGVWSQLHPAFLTPVQIVADDVPDIIRKRRPKQTGYRKINA